MYFTLQIYDRCIIHVLQIYCRYTADILHIYIYTQNIQDILTSITIHRNYTSTPHHVPTLLAFVLHLVPVTGRTWCTEESPGERARTG